MKIARLYRVVAVSMAMLLVVPVSAMAAQTKAPVEEESAATADSEPIEETKAPETPAPETQSTEPVQEVTETETKASETPSSDPVQEITEPPTGGTEPQTEPKTEEPDDKGKEDVDDSDERNKPRDKDAIKDGDPNYTPDERFSTIIKPDLVKSSFRFTTVAKIAALAKADNTRVYENYGLSGKSVGVMNRDDICYVLEIKGSWAYIESGIVRGFVKANAIDISNLTNRRIRLKSEPTFTKAKAFVDPTENQAWTFAKVTSGKTLVDKDYAIVKDTNLNIREGQDEESRVVGKLSANGLCYVLADADQEWVYVESGDTRGFVKGEFLTMGEEADQAVEEKGEGNFELASEEIEPEDNKACYYTLTSVKEPKDDILQYLGNFTLTAYCSCPVCCGQWSGGPCAGGVYPVQGRTIAMAGVEFGTKLVINGEVYTVEDRGTPYGHADIYMVNHGDAVQFGRQYADAYLLNETE